MFKRAKPLATFHRLVRLHTSDEDADKAIVRVPNGAVDSWGQTPYKFQRLQAVIITNQDNGKSILRFVHGAGWMKGMTNDTLAVSYDGFLNLGIPLDEGEDVELVMRPAKPSEVWGFYWNHSNPVLRFNTRLAVAGILLATLIGVVGIIISILLV